MRSSEAAGSSSRTSTTNARVTDSSVRKRCRKIASTSSTLDLDALPKTFSRRRRSKLFTAGADKSQCASKVFVSGNNAPALMIFDEYAGAAERVADFLAFLIRPAIRRLLRYQAPQCSSGMKCRDHHACLFWYTTC